MYSKIIYRGVMYVQKLLTNLPGRFVNNVCTLLRSPPDPTKLKRFLLK